MDKREREARRERESKGEKWRKKVHITETKSGGGERGEG